MKLLLDTHIVLWSAREPARLRSDIATALEDVANELWYSPISVWEVLILADKGRLAYVDKNRPRFIARLFAGMREAPVNTHVAMASRTVSLPHEDPADRFIAATAQIYDLALVTEDTKLAAIQGVSVFGH
jgi:PIN domain nuclease of toxin-antitoxin system